MELDKIYLGDCLDGLRSLPDQCVDLIVTDPPYKVIAKGNSGTMSGYWTSDATNKGKIFQYNNIDIEEYLNDFYRVLKSDAHCYIMCNNLNLPHFFETIGRSQFRFVKLLVWNKVTSICGRYYMGQVEHIFFLRKGKDKPINDCGTSDLLTFKNKYDDKVHESQKPVALMTTLIKNSTNENDLVLDPFMGSGTTAVACIKEHRHYVGFEIDKEYYDKANQRIENEKAQMVLDF